MRFEDLRIQPPLLKAIHELGFETPTPIQQKAIPLLLQGSDVIAQAQTGTGKTAAFALTILQVVHPSPHVQALILVPTRELALQVTQEFKELGKYRDHRVLAVYGGEDISRQIRPLSQGVDVVVGTPGRVLDHLERKTLSLEHVKILVLDEADRMLDMGFIDDVKKIVSYTPASKQTMLFSATMPEEIVELAKKTMIQPETVRASPSITVEKIRQHYISVDARDKVAALCTLLSQRKPRLAIVFVRTKKGADSLHYALKAKGFDNVSLHGNLTQARREKSMHLFRKKHAQLLVATDIAARGLDVDDVELVVNYNLPDEAEMYVHRIGRTARAGKEGDAVTFVSNLLEKRSLDDIAARMHSHVQELRMQVLPEFKKFVPLPHASSFGRRQHQHRSRDRPLTRRSASPTLTSRRTVHRFHF